MGLKRAIFERVTNILPAASMHAAFVSLGARLNVDAIRVSGRNGVLQGAIRDTAVMRTYAETGQWAWRTVELVRTLFGAGGGTYIDVGANVGATVVPIAQNSKVSCIALEPEPVNFKHLQVNVLVNCPAGNVSVRQVAAFSHESTLEFELSPDNMGDHRVRTKNAARMFQEEQWRVIKVQAQPLDQLVQFADGPLAVKIDTQGAEPFVVEGARQTLGRADLVIMEYGPYWIDRLGDGRKRLLAFLEGVGPIAIARGENEKIEGPISASQACEQLGRLPSDPSAYVDVIFGREVGRVLQQSPRS